MIVIVRNVHIKLNKKYLMLIEKNNKKLFVDAYIANLFL